ncbi:shikimate dehydrogenase [Candidatus Methanosphaera massiliense]|jgi:shikimate dehydrogenase|uniref:shikimate dehydrogenase n=1 Tax=Methanosphaera TaxID=2316 RepID=UPI000DC24D37|nr:shikimate dehydrogenase [Candidatus Methanosphaera massiliense]MDD6286443.1 shikimate dehydrogenase [Methanobacteriaceae archaeon]MDE4078921.1 shikimate dehydrogenase [Candidatus Methanosphaera massiliense]MDY2744933.1 shikimate dehydrogenase [Methanosphaera sp.]RAP45019.1 MAG: shikimate dehydrogenase [Methanosphaera sp. SHI1033]
MITGKTLITGVIGHPIEHSFSPPMHNNAYKLMNMDYKYVPFHVQPENIEHVIIAAKTLNIQGLNVTIPYKTEIIPYLDQIDETARKINAVNTISFKDGIAKGYNTDGMGAVKSIKEYTSLKDKNVLVIGAGGASKAITFTLINEDINTLTIANRSKDNASKLISNLRNQTNFMNISYQDIKDTNEIISEMDIIINTTPIGMYPNHNVEPPIEVNNIVAEQTVMDIIYNPLETELLKQAKLRGAQTIPGTKMLINQGITAFEIFTGKTPSYESFEEPLLASLKKQQ